MSDILVFDPARRHNGDLIRDAAQLGWLPEPVFDATYGDGKFWSEYKPETLITNDRYKPADHQWNWRQPVHPEHGWRRQFGCVVFDPDYKLQGTGSAVFADMNMSYGMDRDKTVGQRMDDIRTGAINCSHLVAVGGFMLVKCMDQIACGQMQRQTDMVIEALEPSLRFESWLHLPMKSVRPQRSQRKPRNNYSTLLAFKRRK